MVIGFCECQGCSQTVACIIWITYFVDMAILISYLGQEKKCRILVNWPAFPFSPLLLTFVFVPERNMKFLVIFSWHDAFWPVSAQWLVSHQSFPSCFLLSQVLNILNSLHVQWVINIQISLCGKLKKILKQKTTTKQQVKTYHPIFFFSNRNLKHSDFFLALPYVFRQTDLSKL